MRTTRVVHNMQTGRRLMCCMPTMPGGDFCDRDGYELYKVRVRNGEQRTWFVFCSERHRQLFINSHRELGKLPSGSRGTIL
jgi:hypothetical protein